MVPGWVAFKIVSDSPALHSRWLLLLKIEISSNGQNCSILSQNVPKFELYKHNDELFNIYYRIFYELWTFANFDRLCKLEKRGDEIKKKLLLWNYWANLNQNLLKWFLDGPLPNLFPVIPTSNQDGRQAQNRKKGGNETTEPISTKLCWNDSWMAPFQICWSRLPTKMAAKLKIEKRGDEILIVHCCFSVSQNELKF